MVQPVLRSDPVAHRYMLCNPHPPPPPHLAARIQKNIVNDHYKYDMALELRTEILSIRQHGQLTSWNCRSQGTQQGLPALDPLEVCPPGQPSSATNCVAALQSPTLRASVHSDHDVPRPCGGAVPGGGGGTAGGPVGGGRDGGTFAATPAGGPLGRHHASAGCRGGCRRPPLSGAGH